MKKLLLVAAIIGFVLPFTSHASFDTNLKYGMSNTDVSQLQDLLTSEGCLSVPSTGYFGVLTLKGVQCFQTKYNISPVSGYFGVLSRTQANSLVENITASSNQDEQQETGTVTSIVTCSNGAKFNTQTGKPCQTTTTDLSSQIIQLQNQVSNLQNSIPTTTPVIVNSPAPVVAPTISLGDQQCLVDTGNPAFHTNRMFAFIPITISGHYAQGELHLVTSGVTDTKFSAMNQMGFAGIGFYGANTADEIGAFPYWIKLTDGGNNIIAQDSGSVTFANCATSTNN